MPKILALPLVAGLILAMPSASFAEGMETSPTGTASLISGEVQLQSNFVARGISQSQGQPSLHAELDVNSDDGMYGGIDGYSINWIDQLYPGDSVDTELDGWLGYRKHFGAGWAAKTGFLRIQFPGQYMQQTPPADQPNSTEAFGSVAWKDLTVQLSYAITDYVNTPDSNGTLYLNLSASQPVGESWTLGAAVGRVHEAGHDPVSGKPNSQFNYTDYKLSVACDLGSGISLTLAHTWTNADLRIYTLNGYAVAGHHTWLSLEKDF
jgi:uncharacterized protein (TIGR02001 family)